MEFAHAGLAGLAALAAVPVLLHLLHRPKPKERPFPSLMLLRACARRSRQFARLKNLLLMSVRALAVAGIAFAVARPRLTGAAQAADGGLSVALVVDDSFRMEYRDGAWSRFEEARRRALDVLATLPAGTECSLALASGDSTALLPDPAPVRAELLRARPSDAAAPVLPALVEAARALEGARGRRKEIHVFTDLARAAWTGTVPAPLRGIAVYLHDVGSDDPVNAAVTEVDLRPRSPRTGRPVEIAATVASWGRGGPVTVALEIGGRAVEEKVVPVPAGGTAVVRFRFVPEAGAVLHGAVSLATPDPLPRDDARHFAIAVNAPLRALVVGEGDAPFLSLALAPPRLSHQAVSVSSDADPKGFDAVFLCRGVSAESLRRIADRVGHGGGLAVFASGLLAGLCPAVDGEISAPGRLAPGAGSHPILRSFHAGRNGDLTLPVFSRRLRLRADARWRPAILFDDGLPAALEAACGRGRVLVFAFPLDPAWTDLPKFPCFVPLVHEIARHLAGTTWEDREFEAGAPVVVPLPKPPSEPACSLVDLRSGVRETRCADPAVAAVAVAPALPPGRYALEMADGRRPFSVNLDPAGSDPTRITREEIARRIPGAALPVPSGRGAAGEIRRAREHRELAVFVLLSVAALLLVELWLANRP